MHNTTTKRAKSIKACVSCRKHKTRCEILDGSVSLVQCHRCKVLSLACSYETQRPVVSDPLPKGSRVTKGTADAERPQQLAAAPNRPLWSFVEGHNIDWSAPMLAIQHLITLPPISTTTKFVNKDLSLSMILPEGRIDYLINLFNAQYTPWLNFQPIRNSSNPLVDIACSAVAARHLDCSSGEEVRLRLQNLTYESIAQLIFKPGATDSVEAVQCLLILSLWGPFSTEPETGGWDTDTLMSAAVNMAGKLHLNRASATVSNMRNHASPDAKDLLEASERARLWIALTNAESLLCLGTRRTPMSRRCLDDHLFVQFPQVLDAETDLQNLRLGLIARSFDLFEEGTALCLGTLTEDWAIKMRSVLSRMKLQNRLLMPLPVVVDIDQFYFHILQIQQGMCRLLVLSYTFSAARTSLPPVPPGTPWHEHLLPGGTGEGMASQLGRDLLHTSEAVLVSFLATPAKRLCTAPDTYFNLVALAAGYLVGVKFLVRRMSQGRLLLGASDLLLAGTVTSLHRAACGPGHAADRCALLVQSMLAKWQARDLPASSSGLGPQTHTIPTYGANPPSTDFARQGDGVSMPSLAPHVPPTPTQTRTPNTTTPTPTFDVEFMFEGHPSMQSEDAAFWEMLLQDSSAGAFW
ncbi:hypothetical protein K438DRAFT_2012292 [Mycena galopus ATCC 62051]|nr:hypothetical protein K438DRAFT_2012292 [Mycena galopus ATCC 62051]